MTSASADDLLARLDGTARIEGSRLVVTDPPRFRRDVIERLVNDAVFNPEAELRDAARWLIWSASQALGCGSASIHELYLARGRGEFSPPASRSRPSMCGRPPT